MKLANPIKFRPRSMTYLLLTAFFVVGGFYIFIVNKVANKGTELNNLYQDNKNLYAENERLDTEAARLASLRVIDQSANPEVQTGDQESKSAATPAGATDNKPVNVQGQEISFVAKPKPKLVLTQKQVYLPDYSAISLAKK